MAKKNDSLGDNAGKPSNKLKGKNGIETTMKGPKKVSDASKIEKKLKRGEKHKRQAEEDKHLKAKLKTQADNARDWDTVDDATELAVEKHKKIKTAKTPKSLKPKDIQTLGHKVKKLKKKKKNDTAKALKTDHAPTPSKIVMAVSSKAPKVKKKSSLKGAPSIIIPKKKKFLTLDEDINQLTIDDILNFDVKRDSDEDRSFQQDDDELDLARMIKKALKDHSPVPNDLKIDDRDLKMAKNFFEFSTSQEFLNQKPFVKQLEIAIKTFAEYNPDLTNMEWFEDVPVDATYDDFLENVQLLEHGKCPKTGVTKCDLVQQKKLWPYTEIAASLGQRSGKSFLAMLMAAYQTHGLIKLQKPSAAFGLAKGVSTFHGSLVSLTFKQAKENMYDTLFGLMAESKWFQDYHKLLDYYGKKYGEELYKFKDTFFEYRCRDFIMAPSGPDKRILRGRTRYISAIDEVGWIMSGVGPGEKESKSVKYNADEIHKALKNSQRTAVSGYKRLLREGYYTVIPPLMINISSPSSKYDLITRLVERSKSSKSIIGFNKATWEFNPTIKFEDLEDEFKEDPEKAWRDFGAVPPLSAATFISDVENFRRVVDKGLTNAIEVQTVEIPDKKVKKTFTTGRLKQKWVDTSAPKCLCIDAGEVDNSFAFAMGHNIMNEDGDFIPVIDGMGEIFVSKEAPANFTYIERDVLIPLIENNGITHVFADRWQSTKLLSDLADKCGVEVEKYSLKYNDFASFRDDLYVGGWVLPKPEMNPKDIVGAGDKDYPFGFKDAPISHFIFQALTVKDMGNKGVHKGDHSTDDLFRATVLLHKFLVDPEYRELFEGNILKRKDRALGSYRSISTGSVGTFGTNNGPTSGPVSAVISRSAFIPGKSGPKIFSRNTGQR